MYVEILRTCMAHEHDSDTAEEPKLNPVGLSVAGGFLGTVTGLKKGGVGGAVLGGLVGGTAGYVAGAAANGTDRRVPDIDTDVEPISIETDEEGDEDADADEHEDADADDHEDTEADDHGHENEDAEADDHGHEDE